jgi:glycosyltransferase involved in cell wall biosynthesis
MRIGLISLGRRGSGGPFSLELAVQLQTYSQVFAVVSAYAENLAAWREAPIPLIETTTYQGLGDALASWINQRRLGQLARQIEEQQPDVLIYPIFHTWTPFLQRKLRPRPNVVVVHDPEPHPGDVTWILENITIRQATRCVLMSERLKPALVRRGILPERIDIIPHGPLHYPTSRQPQKDTRPVVLFFGRITRYKGLEVLLQAWPAVQQPCRLVIAGEGDLAPYRPLLDQLAEVEIINQWIPDEQVGELFARAAVVVLPYTSATQSGVLAIASARGLPVVATRSGGLPEQIQHGTTGLLVTPGSATELAEAIDQLLSDPAYAARLGAALQRESETTRSWEQLAPLYLESCRKALAAQEQGQPDG